MATDSFTRANETPIGSPWIHVPTATTDIRLNTNAMNKAGSSSDEAIYYNTAASSADHYSQFLYVSNGGADEWGPAVRVAGTASINCYWMRLVDQSCSKFIAGSNTIVEALTFTIPTGSTYRIEVSGTTITCKKDGTQVTGSPSTDSSLSTGQPGAFIFDTVITVDDFDGGDLSAGAVSRTPLIGAAAFAGVAPTDKIDFRLSPSTTTKI